MYSKCFSLFLLICVTNFSDCSPNRSKVPDSKSGLRNEGYDISNHPPLNEELIPVIVVSEPESKEKSLPVTERTVTTYHPRFLASATTKPTEEVRTTTVDATTTSSRRSRGRGRGRGNIINQIPVEVIYETTTVKAVTGKVTTKTTNQVAQRQKTVEQKTVATRDNVAEKRGDVIDKKDVKKSVASKNTDADNVPNSKELVTSTTVAPKEETSDKKQNSDVISKSEPQENSSPSKPSEIEKTDNAKSKRQRDPVVPIVDSKNIVLSHTGEFHYSFEGGDGTKAFGNGILKTAQITSGEETAGEAVEGGFSYKDKEGRSISLTYTADENGYRPVGDHLPTPPPIPPAIARALQHLATKTTPADDVTESSVKKHKKNEEE